MHRQTVRDAVLDAAAELVSDRGISGLTMAHIAECAGIGRATVYKYFPDVESILVAWHERHVRAHVARLAELSTTPGTSWQRVEALSIGYAQIAFHRDRQAADLGALVHRGPEVASAHQEVIDVFTRALKDAADDGEIRSDTPPRELALFCAHALTAAGGLASQAGVRRVVAVTLAGIRPPR